MSQRTVWIIYIVVLFLSLGLLEVTFGKLWGYVPDDAMVEMMVGSSLSLSGITVAVLGLLLTLYVGRDLHSHDKGTSFRILLMSLFGATVVGFTASLCGLSVLSGNGGAELREGIPYLFIAVPAIISIGMGFALVTILIP